MAHSVFSDDYVTVTHEPAVSLFVYARSTTPYPSVESFRAHHAALAAALAPLSSEKAGLLFDIRAATPRNDPAFEGEVTRAIGVMLSHFARCAFLVRTAVGVLQLRRLAAANGLPPEAVFTDEAAARRYLTAHP
jgi:hypothetical protein